ncbi:MAG: PilZ domain-containing protein [Planctomycetes bacterium]|nr:PilZ domain-containing protein [Planctomycetota bacterium]
MSRDRRRFDRLPVSLEVEITDLETFETEEAFLSNLGPSGAFVTSRVLFPRQSRLVLDFRLDPGEPEISLIARVLWHRTGLNGSQHGFGCQFEQVSRKDEASIHEFILGQRTHGREFVL